MSLTSFLFIFSHFLCTEVSDFLWSTKYFTSLVHSYIYLLVFRLCLYHMHAGFQKRETSRSKQVTTQPDQCALSHKAASFGTGNNKISSVGKKNAAELLVLISKLKSSTTASNKWRV